MNTIYSNSKSSDLRKEKALKKYRSFVGEYITVKGANEPRTVLIEDVYLLADNPKYPAFKCRVVGDYKYWKEGERENLLCVDVIKNSKIIDVVHVFTA